MSRTAAGPALAATLGDNPDVEPLLWLSAPFAVTAAVALVMARRTRTRDVRRADRLRRSQLQRIEAVLRAGDEQGGAR